MSLALWATYPMLPEAKAWLRSEGPGLDDLVTDFVYNRARDRTRERVREALEGGDPVDPVLLSEVDAEMELLSHPLARLLVSAVDESLLLNRFAVAEAKRVTRCLERDTGMVVEAVAETLEVPYRRRDRADGTIDYGLHFVDYLLKSPNERSWQLVRRDPEAGWVWLGKEDFVRLLEEVYKNRLISELGGRAKQVPAIVHEVFRGDIERLKGAARTIIERRKEANISEFVPEAFPPCMKRIMQDMHDHVNVPHMGRFAIVTFLHSLGKEADDILEFFSTVPDFDPEKSRYQIEHITGKGGPTEYTPPGCHAMQSYGVCPLEERDDTCAKIKHPLAHYRRSLWAHERKKEREAAAQPAAPPAPEAKATVGGDA